MPCRSACSRASRWARGSSGPGPYFGSARVGWDPFLPVEEVHRQVDALVEEGVAGFKAKTIRAPHLEALIERAHYHGLSVTGHLGSGFLGSVNPRDAIHMGIDRIEHFMGGDAMPAERSAYASFEDMTPDMPEFERVAQLYLDEGVNYNATMSAYGYSGGRDPDIFENFADEMSYLTPYARDLVEERLAAEPRRVSEQFERIYNVKQRLVKRFYDMGGGHLITMGTDHPSTGEFFSPFSVHRELALFVKSGIPEAAVLRFRHQERGRGPSGGRRPGHHRSRQDRRPGHPRRESAGRHPQHPQCAHGVQGRGGLRSGRAARVLEGQDRPPRAGGSARLRPRSMCRRREGE